MFDLGCYAGQCVKNRDKTGNYMTKPKGKSLPSRFLLPLLPYLLGLSVAALFVRCGFPKEETYEPHLWQGRRVVSMTQLPGFYVSLYMSHKGNKTMCTGTHIGQGVILTAAHCVVATREDTLAGTVSYDSKVVDEVRYLTGARKEVYSLKNRGGNILFSYHPNYERMIDQRMLFDDLALVFIKPPANKPIAGSVKLPFSKTIKERDIAGQITIYGEGLHRDFRNGSSYVRFYGNAQIDDKYSGVHFDTMKAIELYDGAASLLNLDILKAGSLFPRLKVRQEQRSHYPPLKLSINGAGAREGEIKGVCKGDSGGGSIKTFDGEETVVAVTSASAMSPSCLQWEGKKCCTKGELVNVFAYYEWIEKTFKKRGLEWSYVWSYDPSSNRTPEESPYGDDQALYDTLKSEGGKGQRAGNTSRPKVAPRDRESPSGLSTSGCTSG